jgi:hypothetical protein
MGFKHIKRPEEVSKFQPSHENMFVLPPLVTHVRRDDQGRVVLDEYRDEGGGWHSMFVSSVVLVTEPEAEWRRVVWERAKVTGYDGDVYSFFCRDSKESRDHNLVMEQNQTGIRFSWFVWNKKRGPEPPSVDWI